MNCLICDKELVLFSQATVMGKHRINYFRCPNCGFIQTEKPYWLEEAYQLSITDYDTGLVARNIALAKVTRRLLIFLLKPNPNSIYIDYGGGYGLFVRLMRDEGFPFYWYDKYTQNLFAKGFEADLNENYELLTAFELFEHLPDPRSEIQWMVSISENILFSTEIIPNNTPKPGEWVYYGVEHGQHISFFTLKSLSLLSQHINLNFHSDGYFIHLFTKRKLPRGLFKKICHSRIIGLFINIMQRKKQ